MIKKHLILTLAFVAGLAMVARAERSLAGTTELGIQGGGIFFEGDGNLNEDWMYGARIGQFFTNNIVGELNLLAGRTEVEHTDNKVDLLLPLAEVQYVFGSGNLRPFVAAGAGVLNINPERYINRENTDFVIDYGAGVRWLFTPAFAARVDARHVIDTESGTQTHDALLTAGLSWLYGGIQETPKKQVAKAASADSDNDGIPNDQDLCPNTPAGVKVDARGCPVDSDNDGVPDTTDQCPDTPSDAAVDAKGCPLDSDGDGVTDSLDDCPKTPAGTKVDAKGCPEGAMAVPEKEWVLKGVHFETGAGKINPKSYSALDEAAGILTTHSKVRVEIGGHTDNVGAVATNNSLSAKRAEAVKKYLVEKGVAADRLETKGYGSSNPVADNATKDGRAANRRIEFKVISQ